jgi:hypothetical protein
MTYTRPSTTVYQPVGDVWDDLEEMLTGGGALSADQANPADNINQTDGGGFSTSAADFTVVGTACKPKNLPALNAARGYQAQLNRVASVKGFSKIATDGAIGPATLALHRLVQSAAGGSVMGDPSSCMGIAPDVDILGMQVKEYADSLGAPAQVSAAVSLKAPTILTKSGQTVVAPDAGIAGSLARLSGVEKVAIAGLGGAILWLTLGKKKRR